MVLYIYSNCRRSTDPVVQSPLTLSGLCCFKGGCFICKSNRPFKSISEQIKLLKERGLIIDSEEKTKNFLLFKNYYNIINRYGQYYYDPSSEQFDENTHFDQIVDLYFFDNDLKHIFYRKLMKVESHFKSVMSHIFTEHHDEQFAYLNPNNFDRNKKHEQISFIGKLANQIKYNSGHRVPDNPIKHHMEKYGNVPFWVLVNYMYFNDAVKFYMAMNKSEQNKIAEIFYKKYCSEYNIENCPNDKITPEQLDSFLRIMIDYRNLIAHDNFLFGAEIKTLPKYSKCVYSPFGIKSSEISRSLYTCFIVMRVFLEYNTYKNLYNKILKLLKKLAKNTSEEKVNAVLEAMGFPSNWHKQKTLQ